MKYPSVAPYLVALLAIAAAACGTSGGRPVNNLVQSGPMHLSNSGSEPIAFSGDGQGHLTATLGVCGTAGCGLSGVASGTLEGNAVTGYQLQLAGPITLQSQGAGAYRVAAGKLQDSALVLTGPTGATAFNAALTSLTFTQAAAGSVTMDLNAGGAIAVTISARIQLGATDTLAAVLGAPYPTAVAGLIVPGS
ncbi:MAG TPA: hypothetical protein VN515_08415 [Terriglobales bacterium]|nr:hypothetical protein [Terriglobales bacterium]